MDSRVFHGKRKRATAPINLPAEITYCFGEGEALPANRLGAKGTVVCTLDHNISSRVQIGGFLDASSGLGLLLTCKGNLCLNIFASGMSRKASHLGAISPKPSRFFISWE